MSYKNYLKGLLLFLGIILFSSLSNTIMYYNDILNINIVRLIEMITLIIASAVVGLYIGMKSMNKGYVNGLIFSGIIILLSLIINLITSQRLTWISVISYLVMTLVTTGSSIVGINKKK